jgi:predicted ATPase
VSGAVGVGKSRLRYEFVKRVREAAPDAAIWLARGNPVGVGSAFALVSEAVQSAFALHDTVDPTAVNVHLQSYLAPAMSPTDAARIAADLSEMLRSTRSDADDPRGEVRRDAVLRGDRIRESFAALLAYETKRRPLLLVLEDLHWGDPSSVAMIDDALAAMPDRRLCIVAFARPEIRDRFPRLWEDRALTSVQLPELSKKASTRLIQSALPGVPQPQVDAIVDRAGGNAFFLEELVRCIHDGRGDRLPDTVLGIVQRRFDELRESERRLLRLASVTGRVFWRGALATLAGIPSEQLETELAPLLAA